MTDFLFSPEAPVIIMGLSAALIGIALLLHIRKEPKHAHGTLRN